MPRFQFRLSTLLWLTLAVACWFGGMRFERWRRPDYNRVFGISNSPLGPSYGPPVVTWADGTVTTTDLAPIQALAPVESP